MIVLNHTWNFSTCILDPSFPLQQNLLAASYRFLLPDPHVGMLSSHTSVLLQNQMQNSTDNINLIEVNLVTWEKISPKSILST